MCLLNSIEIRFLNNLFNCITYRLSQTKPTGWPKSCDPNVWAYSSEICCPLELTLGKHDATINHSRI